MKFWRSAGQRALKLDVVLFAHPSRQNALLHHGDLLGREVGKFVRLLFQELAPSSCKAQSWRCEERVGHELQAAMR